MLLKVLLLTLATVSAQKIKVSLNHISSEIIDIKWCGSQTTAYRDSVYFASRPMVTNSTDMEKVVFLLTIQGEVFLSRDNGGSFEQLNTRLNDKVNERIAQDMHAEEEYEYKNNT